MYTDIKHKITDVIIVHIKALLTEPFSFSISLAMVNQMKFGLENIQFDKISLTCSNNGKFHTGQFK